MAFSEPAVIAGFISTILFASSNIPMLLKAVKTRDLSSYSLGYLVLSNIGNVFHWFYISHLAIGPLWLLHGFFTLSCGLMLIWYIRYEGIHLNQSFNRIISAPAAEFIGGIMTKLEEVASCGRRTCDCIIFCLCNLASA